MTNLETTVKGKKVCLLQQLSPCHWAGGLPAYRLSFVCAASIITIMVILTRMRVSRAAWTHCEADMLVLHVHPVSGTQPPP